MSTVAATIQDQFDALLDEYDRRLQKHPAYAAMPAPFRREAARRTLGFTADWLQSGNDAQLLQFIQSTAQQRAEQGLDIKIMQHAVNELESILEPLITDVETAKLIWRTLSKAQDAITQQATERLIAEGNRLRQMVDRSPVGIYHTTPEGHIVDANEMFLKIVGYASLEAINQVGAPALYENPADRQRLLTLLQQGPVTGFETNFRRADGHVITISLNVRLAQEAGITSYLEGILEDITERKRAEKEVRRLLDLQSAILNNAGYAVIAATIEGIFTTFNPTAERMLGYTADECVGKLTPAIFHDLDEVVERAKLFSEELGVTIDPGFEVFVAKARYNLPNEYEWTYIRKDGSRFPVLLSVTALRDPQGDIIGFLGLANDITERKRIEQRLNESEERYRRLSDATVEGIVVHDKGILLDANEVFAKMFGYELSEVIGMAATEFLTPETREITAQNIRSGYEKPYEVMGLRKDGSTFPVEITGKAIPYEGRTVRVTALRDITERQRSREQIERSLQETRVRFEVSQALAGQKTEDEVLASLIQQAGIYPQALATIATFDKTGDDIVAVARYAGSFESGLTPNLPMGTRFPFSQFPLFRLLSADRPFVSPDTFADDRMDAASIEITRETGAAGFAVFPLTTDNEWLGFMMVFVKSIGFFDEGKQHLYQALAEQGAKALQTARLRDQIQTSLERRGRQVQLSTEVAQEIAAAPKLEELFQRVVTLIKERFGYYHAQIFRYDPAQDAVVLVTGYGEAGQKMLAAGHKLAMGRGVVGTAAAASRSILASDVAQDKDWLPNRNLPDTKGELAVPIKLRDQVLGILDVQSTQAGALTAEDQLLLEGLCGQIAIAIENKRTETALIREQYLMHALMDNVPDYIYFKDRESRFIRISKAHARSFGLNDPTQAVGKTDFDFFTEEHARLAYEDEQEIIRTGQPISKEEKETRPDQPDRWVMAIKLPLRDEANNTVGTFGISRDITERKQSEIMMQAALAETEALYHLSSSIISFKDLPDLLQTVTNSVAELLPADRVSLISFDLESRAVTHFMTGGPGSSDVVTAIGFDELWDGLSGWVLRELKPALSLKNVPDPRESLAVQQRRRETNCGAIIVTPLIYHDRLLGTLTAINRPDETNFTQKNVELMMAMANQAAAAIENARLLEQRQASEAQLRTLIENAPEAILVLDADTGLFLSSNENATKLYSLDREALTKVGLVDMSPPNQPDGRPSAQALSEYITTALNGGTPDFEWIHRNAAGQLIPCEVRLVRMPAAGHSLIRVSVNDITIRRQAEIQMQETLHELERLYRATAREGWQAYRETAQTTPGYLFDRISLTPQDSWGPQLERGIQQDTRALSIGEQSVAVAPLAVRGEVIGAVGVYDDPNQPLSPDELTLLREIAEQGALALENARLFEQTQRDAERESTINRITGRIRNARSIEEVLTVATQELRLATQASRSVVDIAPHTAKPARADFSPASGNGSGAGNEGVKV